VRAFCLRKLVILTQSSSSSSRLKEQISKKLEIENPHPIIPQALSQDLFPSLPSLSLPSLCVCVHLEEPGAGRLKLPPYLCLQPHTGLMRNTCWEGLISPGTVESLLSGYLLILLFNFPKPKQKKKKKQSGVGLVNIMGVSCVLVYFTHAHLELQN
jgi:hypothetical protein